MFYVLFLLVLLRPKPRQTRSLLRSLEDQNRAPFDPVVQEAAAASVAT